MIYFVRHGLSEANVKKVFAGQKDDTPLVDEGREQAKATADTIKKQVINEAKSKVQEILTGQKNPNDTTPKKSVQENVKDAVKNKIKFPW